MSWLKSPVAQFLAAGFLTLVAVVVGTGALSRAAADNEAIDDAQALTRVLAQSVAEPSIPRGLVEGDAGALDQLDRRVLGKLLVEDVERIKIWDADGTVLYSDQTELIGSSYPLGADELEILEDGGTDAELSDLDRPENRFERGSAGCSRSTPGSGHRKESRCCSRPTSPVRGSRSSARTCSAASFRSPWAACWCWSSSPPR